MKILGLECSATPASCAIVEDSKIIAQSFVNVKLTHSQTLLPLVTSMLKASLTDLDDIDGFAITSGPGSFTGIRIGISALKGLACAGNKPCFAVSTLRAIAENFSDYECIVCAVMDARCNQVYNALFSVTNGHITRLCEDRAVMIIEVCEELKKLTDNGKPIYIAGDGADIFYPFAKDIKNVKKASPQLSLQNASSVCLAAEKEYKNTPPLSAEELLPFYLRLPQAERELNSKEKK